MNTTNNQAIFISALNKENLDDFKEITYQAVKKIHKTRFPYHDYLYTEYDENGNS